MGNGEPIPVYLEIRRFAIIDQYGNVQDDIWNQTGKSHIHTMRGREAP